jgi:hypothetical protein
MRRIPARAQERWVVAPEGVLMGSSWEFPEGKAGYAEIMTIKPDGDAVVMVLRHFDGGLKRRSADKLLIVGDFLHHGTPDHEEWHVIKSGD